LRIEETASRYGVAANILNSNCGHPTGGDPPAWGLGGGLPPPPHRQYCIRCELFTNQQAMQTEIQITRLCSYGHSSTAVLHSIRQYGKTTCHAEHVGVSTSRSSFCKSLYRF
jgi:hypothetical protein